MVWNFPLVNSGQLFVSCPQPASSLAEEEGKGEEAMMLYKHCLVIAKTLVCYQPQIQNTAPYIEL